jgi:hypothetical protein
MPTFRRQFTLAALVLGLGIATLHTLGAATVTDDNIWATTSVTGSLGRIEPGTTAWLYSFDTQLKLADHDGKLAQYTWRAAIGRPLGSHWSVWAGYSHAEVDTPLTSKPYREHRPFGQVVWTDSANGFALTGRLRIEDRLLNTGHDAGLRTRHLARASHPIGDSPRLTGVVWDEVFLNWNNTDFGSRRGLDQNRLFGGFGWKQSDSVRWETGYLHNFNHRPGLADRLNRVWFSSLAFSFK